MVNLTQVPEVIGNMLNVPIGTAGIIMAVLITIALVIGVSLIAFSELTVAFVGLASISMFTFIGWFPIWITIFIGLGIAVMLGRKTISKDTGDL